MGEGWGEGDNYEINAIHVPLPLIPSHQWRGDSTFYETIKLRFNLYLCLIKTWQSRIS